MRNKCKAIFALLLAAGLLLSFPQGVIGALSAEPLQAQAAGSDGTTNWDFIEPVTHLTTVPAGYTAIRNSTDLNNMRNNLGGKYILMADIDLSGISNWVPVGTSAAPFTGQLDGNGYAIKNLVVDSTSDAGLFGRIRMRSDQFYVKNLAIIGGKIKSSVRAGAIAGTVDCTIYGKNFSIANCYIDIPVETISSATIACAGGIIGTLVDTVSVDKILNNGSVYCSTTAGGGYALAGGFLGRAESSTFYVQKSGNTGSVTVNAANYSNAYAGGLIGSAYASIVYDCYNQGEVKSTAPAQTYSYVGGILGEAQQYTSYIRRSYNSAKVSYTSTNSTISYAGGMVGYSSTAYGGATLANCYYLSTSDKHVGNITNNNSAHTNVQALSDSDLRKQSSFDGFDFDTIWVMAAGGGYPVLRGMQEIIDPYLDSDGDGLPDVWEINGIDFNGVYTLPIHLMGADPNVPDIFVECDWMTDGSKSYKPSEKALYKVYEAFKNSPNGKINIHIDAGPDSTDFVTGKKWSEYPGGAGGNLISGTADWTKKDYKAEWEKTQSENFSFWRRKVFRYAIFLNGFYLQNNKVSYGQATEAVGIQSFLIASGMSEITAKLENIDFDLFIARNFMHELGHTLGLKHGGCDDINNKPNYISIMNYTFTMVGLPCANINYPYAELDYSRWELPSLNENRLDETKGIDPEGKTSGTGISTIWYNRYLHINIIGWPDVSYKYKPEDSVPIARQKIDFNTDGKFDTAVKADINKDGNYSNLFGYNDWDNIVYNRGVIGSWNEEAEMTLFIEDKPDLLDDELVWPSEIVPYPFENTLTITGPTTVDYKGTITLTADKPVNFTTDSKYITLEKVDSQTVKVTSTKSFIKTGSAEIKATPIGGGEATTVTVKVKPTFIQWLMIIILFGWLWM